MTRFPQNFVETGIKQGYSEIRIDETGYGHEFEHSHNDYVLTACGMYNAAGR